MDPSKNPPPMAISPMLCAGDLEKKLLVHSPGNGLPLLEKVRSVVMDVCVNTVDDALATLPSDARLKSIDDIEKGGVIEVIKLVRESIYQFCPQAVTLQEITQLNNRVSGGRTGETVLISFIYKIISALAAVFDRNEINALAVKIMASTSEFQRGSGLVSVPGWVPTTEAEEFVNNVYWMVPLVFMSTLSYSEFIRNINLRIAARNEGTKHVGKP